MSLFEKWEVNGGSSKMIEYNVLDVWILCELSLGK